MPAFHLISIFPEFFSSPLCTSLLGKAIQKNLVSVSLHNPRDYAKNPHRHVDDAPFGGGPGMIIQPQPVAEAIAMLPKPGKIILMSPAGKQLTPRLSRKLAQEENLTIICGRYEGVDARLQEIYPIEEIAFGETILNGGETAALAVMESVARFIPGFMHQPESLENESLSAGLLEYPQYTRPEKWGDKKVPEVLLSGNHKKIAEWRRQMSLTKTLMTRPELLDVAPLSHQDREYLSTIPRLRAARNLSFCLVHAPIKLDKGKTGISSLTNLDIHDISRISHAYGMGPFYILTPLQDQLSLAETIIWHWTKGPGSISNPDRAQALRIAQPVASFENLAEEAKNYYGEDPIYLVASAVWPKKHDPVTFKDILKICQAKPAIILLGTAGGLDLKSLPMEFLHMRPLRFLDQNHLSVRGAAAIIADRILGDYN